MRSGSLRETADGAHASIARWIAGETPTPSSASTRRAAITDSPPMDWPRTTCISTALPTWIASPPAGAAMPRGSDRRSRVSARHRRPKPATTDDKSERSTPMATRYALEFRSGSYFVNVDRSTGGALHEAATFITEDNATWWFNKFAPWV